MICEFNGQIFNENNKFYVSIPFNVWETCDLKGNIPALININKASFECKLLPKGNGNYYIPVPKNIAEKQEGILNVSIEFIDSLHRINNNSPYTKDNPIRKINSIDEIKIISGYCGHTVLAMVAGVKLEDVVKLFGKGKASWSKIMEALDYYGISYTKNVYAKGDNVVLPKCAIFYDNGFGLWYEGKSLGGRNLNKSTMTSYLKILID